VSLAFSDTVLYLYGMEKFIFFARLARRAWESSKVCRRLDVLEALGYAIGVETEVTKLKKSWKIKGV
jgi:hypothetical protein